MPNLLVKIPHGTYPGDSRKALLKAIHDVVNDVEQMGDSPKNQAVTWIVIEELQINAFSAGGHDISDRIVQAIVQAYVPHGVLDGASRAQYVARLNKAFNDSLPPGDKRTAIVSTLLLEMPEGQWGAGDTIWRLPDVTAAAGFRHLQSLAVPR